MNTCPHGGGASIVQAAPFKPDGPFDNIPAEVFLPRDKSPSVRLELRVDEGGYRVSVPESVVRALQAGGLQSYSGYSRIAAAQDWDGEQLSALAAAFDAAPPSGAPGADPLGSVYTYFGQFIAHEVSRIYEIAGGDFENLNTSMFDLDTVFSDDDLEGEAPHLAPASKLEGGVALGSTAPVQPDGHHDLPRAVDGRPLCPDTRNDANLTLAQLHVAIARRYHALTESASETDARATIRNMICGAVLHDYLKEIVDPHVYNDVMANGRAIVHTDVASPQVFLIPIEFAAAAFRFGHAMVRPTYLWSRADAAHEQGLSALLDRTHAGRGLDAGLFPDDPRRLNDLWRAEWADMTSTGAPPPNVASAIAPSLTLRLLQLSHKFVEGVYSGKVNLASLTLMRNARMRLASAQSIWKRISTAAGGAPIGRFLEIAEICGPCGDPFHQILSDGDHPNRLCDQTPLWFYVLREAEVLHGGRRLGPVGGRIVMETIHAAIETSGATPDPSAKIQDLLQP